MRASRVAFWILLIAFMSLHQPVQAGFGGQPLGDLAWSPDGSMLIGVGTTSEPVIYAVQEDGTVVIQNEDILSLFAGGNYFPTYYERAIAWSPDGTQFAVLSETLDSNADEYDPYTRLLLFDASAPETPVATHTLDWDEMMPLPSLFWTNTGLVFPAVTQGAGTLVYITSPDDLTTQTHIDVASVSTDPMSYPIAVNGDMMAGVVRGYETGNLTQQLEIVNTVGASNARWSIRLSANDDFSRIAWDKNTDIAIAGNRGAIEVYHGRMDDSDFGDLSAYFLLPETRTIVDLDWSPDGEYLAAVDTSGDVFLWTGDGLAVSLSAFELPETLVIDWHPSEPILALGFWNGEASVIDFRE